MIGSDVILFPETGVDFISSLRTAVLYSQRVHVLTRFDFIPPKESEVAFVQAGTGPYKTALAERVLQYFSFVRDLRKDLSMLAAEGILSPLTDRAHEVIHSAATDLVKRLDDEAFAQVESLVAPILKRTPPSFADLHTWLHMGQRLLDPETFSMPYDQLAAWEKDLFGGQDIMHRLYTFVYFATLNVMAEQRGAALSSWSTDYQNASRLYRKLLTSEAPPALRGLAARRLGEARLGRVVVKRHLPLVDDLPFEELLELRRSRADELEAFRVALAELATHIDPTEAVADLDVQIHDVVVRRVDPALRDLRVTLTAARLDAVARLGRSAKGIAAGTVSVVLSLAAGAPLKVSTAVGALSTVAAAFLDYSVERRKLLHASQWSILLDFQRIDRKQRRRVTKG